VASINKGSKIARLDRVTNSRVEYQVAMFAKIPNETQETFVASDSPS